MQNYLEMIEKQLEQAYEVAMLARSKGYDPGTIVEVPIVRDMAERVEGLISVVAPQIVGKGLPERIKKLEKELGALDWRVSLTIALEVSQEKFCNFKDRIEAMEVGIRVGLAYITMGTVASPLEGFTGLKIRKTREGKEYFALQFSGPIRSAGGTGASVCVLIADYVRVNTGYAAYDPTKEEIERSVCELYDYHERVTNLQYLPSEEEVRFLASRIPVQIDGDPSEKFEVSRFKDLDRVETKMIRNGVCLVIGEGIAQKAAKLWKQLSQWGNQYSLGQWDFLQAFLEMQKSLKAKGEETKKGKISPDYTYIKDLVAGRPVLAYPLRSGGFRLRYGRSRASGYSSCAIHPATMKILNNYIATGTQIKMERPGKGAALTACDTIDGPIVKLSDGSVIQISTEEEACARVSEVQEILYLGDILISYGDFYNRNHVLVPAGYCEEWWKQEFEKAIVDIFGSLDIEKCSDFLKVPVSLASASLQGKIDDETAFTISRKLGVPLHPKYTYFWSEISKNQLAQLLEWLKSAKYDVIEGKLQKLVLPMHPAKRALELLGIPHTANKEFVVLQKGQARALLNTLSVCDETLCNEAIAKLAGFAGTTLEFVNTLSPVTIRDRSGTFIGARMGRPEKAKMRKMTGSPHMLFPVGDEGGKMRSFQAALEAKKVTADFPIYRCETCKTKTIFPICESCETKTIKAHKCKICGIMDAETCQKHGKNASYSTETIDINHYFTKACEKLEMKFFPDLIKGVRGTSNQDHTPEHMTKGILRAKHNVYVNKDGTIRYDMTQLAITHFKPMEINTSVEKLRELGYTKDCYGKPLEKSDQVLEIFPQDVILPSGETLTEEGADEILFNATKFIDELLKRLYGMDAFYKLQKPSELVGQMVVCLAPHTSAGILGRIIGFSRTQGFFAHPLLHASTRRDCDGDEACVMLLLDTLLNFSRKYLPAHRGSTQDAPLVLTSKVVPEEVDDMVFDLDIEWKYPLEFYQGCMEYKKPYEVRIERISDRLKTKEYSGFGFTHNLRDINMGVTCSAYKTLPTMEDKLKGQMDLAEKIRAVEASDVATLVIEKHFIKDTKGNLRKFSTQQFRCVNCNEKYRRPPLSGKCSACTNGKIIFTVAEGSVTKYLEPSISLAKKYEVPAYLIQSLELLKRRIEAVFGKEKEKQSGLGSWF
ncbi:MAG: DNA polymerase II large subunit [Candidatus Woesearchaeota archaeon]